MSARQTVLVVEDQVLTRMAALDIDDQAGFDAVEADGADAAGSCQDTSSQSRGRPADRTAGQNLRIEQAWSRRLR